ncbi:hypothetical protein M9H77_26847 [Catharanthus roseus]|uniref:Uncharacterized protein n=1 Tax=Catharanthus roseus TaxID=4058 RepID=A0ACC0ABP9_CATRO|nr:hypothetical protein M9H77_26847 [Catharanthus roseus]
MINKWSKIDLIHHEKGLKQIANKRIINLSLREICIISIIVVAIESMLILEATMDMETSFLKDIMELRVNILSVQKRKKVSFRKSERVKENEFFIEKQESEKEEQREKRIVVLEKSEEVNFYADETNSSFANEFLCVKNIENSSKDEGGKLAYKTINFFPSNSLALRSILRKLSCFHLFSRKIVDKCHFSIANYVSYVLGIEDKGRNMEKELGAILEELPISLSLNPSLMCYKVSFMQLKLFLESYLSYCVSSYDLLKNQLVNNVVSGEPSCFGCELVHDDSSFYAKVCGFLEFNCASFVVFHEKCNEKYVDNYDSILTWFETFMNDFDGANFLNLSLLFLDDQVKFHCYEQKLVNVITSLNTLFENTFGFQFYHFHFKELLLKDFESQMGTNLELFKINSLAFEISNLRKEAFEQISKEKCRPSWKFGNFMLTFSHLILCNTMGEKRCFYANESEFIEAIEKDELVSLLYCKEELSGLSPLKEMEHQIEWEDLKNKLEGFEDQRKASNLFSISSINKDHSREQIGGENGEVLEKCTLPPMVALPLLLPVGFCWHITWKNTPYHVH